MKSVYTPLRRPSNGFAMVEMLMSVVITSLVLAVVAGLWAINSRAFQQQRLRNDQEALVDNDIAAMEDLAYRYTCCPGSCTTNATTISASSTCKGVNGTGTPKVGTEYYYFPYYAANATSWPNSDAVKILCDNGTLVTQLVTDLKNAPLTTSTYAQTGQQLTRTVVAEDPPTTGTPPADSSQSHRIRITYTGNNFSRSTIIVPMAARWCP
ncbi:MAG: prepilin-type N-terminal cleavage/methylation domain-containing protein [Cyanobium sp.]